MIIRGILTSLTEGVLRLFSATGLMDFAKREFIQHYGLASHPKAGAELFIWARGNTIYALGSDDRRYRITLAEGEVAIHDDLGQKVHLKRNGVEITSPKITLNGLVKTTNHLEVATGASGTFNAGGKAVTVKNGIIVGIE